MTYILDQILVNVLVKPGHPNVKAADTHKIKRINLVVDWNTYTVSIPLKWLNTGRNHNSISASLTTLDGLYNLQKKQEVSSPVCKAGI